MRLCVFFYRPYLYLNDEKIAAAKLDHAQVEQAIANALTDFDGINLAVSTKSLATQQDAIRCSNRSRRNQHVHPFW